MTTRFLKTKGLKMSFRWSTIDGQVWEIGNEKFRIRISLTETVPGYYCYISQVMGLNEDGEFVDLVSHKACANRTLAEIHAMDVIRVLQDKSQPPFSIPINNYTAN